MRRFKACKDIFLTDRIVVIDTGEQKFPDRSLVYLYVLDKGPYDRRKEKIFYHIGALCRDLCL